MSKKIDPGNVDNYELPKAVPMQTQVVEKKEVKLAEIEVLLNNAKSTDLSGIGYELTYAVQLFEGARRSFLLRLADLAADADEVTAEKIANIKSALG